MPLQQRRTGGKCTPDNLGVACCFACAHLFSLSLLLAFITLYRLAVSVYSLENVAPLIEIDLLHVRRRLLDLLTPLCRSEFS